MRPAPLGLALLLRPALRLDLADLHRRRALADRLADAGIRAAAADVAQLLELVVADRVAARSVGVVDHRHGRHDLAGLAVAALRDVGLQPRLLHGVQLAAARRGETLDRRDLVGRPDLRDRHRARVELLAVDVARAGLADADAAAVLRAADAEHVAQDPQHADVVLDVGVDALAVEDEGVDGHGYAFLRLVRDFLRLGLFLGAVLRTWSFASPSVGDGGIGGTVGKGSKCSGS